MWGETLGEIVFLGDIICTFWDLKYNNKYEEWFDDVKNSWSNADYVIANLETPIAGEENGYTNHIYSFNTPAELVREIRKAGIKIISTANNHCLDRGIIGLRKTIQALDTEGIKHTGTFDNKNDKPYEVIDIKGKKIGIFAVTYGTNAQENCHYLNKSEMWRINLLQDQELSEPIARFLWKTKWRLRFGTNKANIHKPPHLRYEKDRFQKKRIEKIMEDMNNETDYRVVMMHSGDQFNPIPELRTKKWMNWFETMGADFIVCNHEHIVSSRFDGLHAKGIYAIGDLTGTFGVTQEPYGVYADASVIIRMHIDQEIKFSFSVMTIKETKSKSYVPVSLFEEYERADERKKNYLYWLNLRIYNRVTGMNETRVIVQEEYDLYPKQERLVENGIIQKNWEKDTTLFHVVAEWFLISKKKNIDSFFMHYKVSSIAIYGASLLGEILYKELENSDMSIECFLDMSKAGYLYDKRILSPTEDIPEVDMIIVTAIYDFCYIEKMLHEIKGLHYTPIVSLAEVVLDAKRYE